MEIRIEERESQKEKDPVMKFREEMEKRVLETEGTILILPHSGPNVGMDRDCIYSAVVLRDILRKKFPDKTIEVLTSDDAGNKKSAKFAEELKENDVPWNHGDFEGKVKKAGMVIMVDNYETARAGIPDNTAMELANKGKLMILDHHGSQTITEDKHIETKAKATCELVARMYNDEIDSDMARKLALGILSDSSNLSFVRKVNIRTMEAFRAMQQKSGLKTSELIDLIPNFTEEQLAPIKSTEQPLPIRKFPKSKVVILSEPPEGIPEDDYSELTSEALNQIIKSRPIDEIGEEMTPEEKATEEQKADFSIFVRPVFERNDVGPVVEIKMRSNVDTFVDEIAELGHRGGNPYAGKMEYWPNKKLYLEWVLNKGKRKEIEARMEREAVKEFVYQYTEAKKRAIACEGVIKEFLLTTEQQEAFRQQMRDRLKWVGDAEDLEEQDSKYSYAFRKNVPGFDKQLGLAYDEYIRRIS